MLISHLSRTFEISLLKDARSPAAAAFVASTSPLKMTGTGPHSPVCFPNQGVMIGHLANMMMGTLSAISTWFVSKMLAGAGSPCN